MRLLAYFHVKAALLLFLTLYVGTHLSCTAWAGPHDTEDEPREGSQSGKCLCFTDTAHLDIFLDKKCTIGPMRIDVGENQAFELPEGAGQGCPEKGNLTVYHKPRGSSCSAKTYVGIRCAKK